MKKKFNLKIFIIIFLAILVLAYLIFFNIKKNTKVEFEGYIKEVGVYYVIVNDDINDYLLEISNRKYKVGDKVSVILKNVKNNTPVTGDIVEIHTLSKNVVFSITDDQNSQDNKLNNDDEIIITNNNINTEHNDISKDDQVISYFNNFSSEIDNSNSIKDSIKDKFVTVVDFLFYDGTIGNITFDELTISTKLKILETTLTIDKKIEDKFPGYKESITSTSNRVYTNVKSKSIETYLEITTTVCQNKQELCADAKDGLSKMKSSLGITWDFIKEISGIGLKKLKSWYEIWKEV